MLGLPLTQRTPAGFAPNALLVRGIGFAIFALAQIVAEFHIEMRGRLASLIQQYKTMQAEDGQSGALNIHTAE